MTEADDRSNLAGKWGGLPAGYFKGGVCVRCLHKFKGANGCDAFPEGIPVEIAKGKNDHSQPYPGDHGIMFEKTTTTTQEAT
jgi:hypothetical protein